MERTRAGLVKSSACLRCVEPQTPNIGDGAPHWSKPNVEISTSFTLNASVMRGVGRLCEWIWNTYVHQAVVWQLSEASSADRFPMCSSSIVFRVNQFYEILRELQAAGWATSRGRSFVVNERTCKPRAFWYDCRETPKRAQQQPHSGQNVWYQCHDWGYEITHKKKRAGRRIVS